MAVSWSWSMGSGKMQHLLLHARLLEHQHEQRSVVLDADELQRA